MGTCQMAFLSFSIFSKHIDSISINQSIADRNRLSFNLPLEKFFKIYWTLLQNKFIDTNIKGVYIFHLHSYQLSPILASI